jgi:hypothetical protein
VEEEAFHVHFHQSTESVVLSGDRGEGKNRNTSRPFDGCGYLTLMTGAVARNPSGNDFPSLCHKISKDLRVFVVDDQVLVCAKSADLSSVERPSSKSTP